MALDNPYFPGFECSICLGQAVELRSYPGDASHDSDVCGKKTAAGENHDDSLMFFPSRVWAFSLWHKSWKRVLPRDLGEVKRQENSFAELLMSSAHKETLESLLLGYLKNMQGGCNYDLLQEKGQGLNMIFHGNPGTGKTLAAGEFPVIFSTQYDMISPRWTVLVLYLCFSIVDLI